MSEERLKRMEEKIDILVSGQTGLASAQTELAARQNELAAGHRELKAGQSELRRRMTGVESRLDKVEAGQEELRSAVMLIAEGHAAHTQQIARGFAALQTTLDTRLRPLEDVVSKHSDILNRHGLS